VESQPHETNVRYEVEERYSKKYKNAGEALIEKIAFMRFNLSKEVVWQKRDFQ
jgi:hypothetical protein